MKHREPVILAVALGLFFMATLVYAEHKLAYVNLERVFTEYKKTKEYDKVLEDKQKGYEREREKKVTEVKKLQEKLSLLSEEEREARRSDLEDKITQLQEFDRSSTQDLRKQRADKINELNKDINKAIEEYAQKEGITIVFDKRALMYGKNSLDITDQITKIINKR